MGQGPGWAFNAYKPATEMLKQTAAKERLTASSKGWKEMAQCVKGRRLKEGPRRSPL